ncbi:MAG: hypothetical protein ABIR30_11330 [Chitinophagaceae bacterium]
MYKELYQFLLQHKQLTVPGTGTFLLERKPASIDFPNKLVIAPGYSVVLAADLNDPPKKIFPWLAQSLGLTARDAVIHFNNFAFDLKNQLADGAVVCWEGVGTISKGLAGNIKFIPAGPLVVEDPVPAEKVIREKAEHMVRVGEDEKTSAEMTEMLNKPDEKRSYWWAYALAIILLAIMFIGWYFSENGLDISSTGNSIKISPQETTVTSHQ